MLYLVDGYNLLYALGVLPGRSGSKGLAHARGRLLGLLHGAFAEESSHVTVVFDAARAPPGVDADQDYHGIQVRYAVGEYEADDLIERLIRKASAPRQLAVVSNDHRIQDAARRRRCRVLACGDFLDELDRRRRPRTPPTQAGDAGKPEGVSRAETQHWLREFADLADDPAMKELFDPFDFEEK